MINFEFFPVVLSTVVIMALVLHKQTAGGYTPIEAELTANIKQLFDLRVAKAVQNANAELINLHGLTAASNRKLRVELEQATKVREELEGKVAYMEGELTRLRSDLTTLITENKDLKDEKKKYTARENGRKRSREKEIAKYQATIDEKNTSIVRAAKRLKEISEELPTLLQ